MTIDSTSLTVIVGIAGTVAGAVGKALVARTQRGTREDSALARVLERRDAEARTLGERLDAARTGEQLAVAQAAAFGAQVEQLTERFADVEERLDVSERRHEDCERRYEGLRRRLNRITPEDMPSVRESSDMKIRVTEVNDGKQR